ncbi:MAG TPA: hypothetical protein VK858_16540, partial [Longimicrobiales bacterium]|nr:hypothetical protein [Longimicrobiales bacterium]
MIPASRFHCTTLALLLSWLVPASPGAGQDVREAAFRPASPADSTPPTDGPGRPLPPPPSLASWADRTWDLLADRSAGDAGAFSRDGLLLRFHEDIDAEYALDHVSSPFDWWEDGAWEARTDGVRYWSGSIDHLQMTDGGQVKVRAAVGGDWAFGFRYDRESVPPLDRNLLRVRIGLDPARGFGAWFGASLQPIKPDRDLELGVGWTGDRTRIRLSVHALDAFSDVIYTGIGVDEDFAARAVDYDGVPLGVRGSLALEAPGTLRLSVHGGVELSPTLRVFEQAAPERGF